MSEKIQAFFFAYAVWWNAAVLSVCLLENDLARRTHSLLYREKVEFSIFLLFARMFVWLFFLSLSFNFLWSGTDPFTETKIPISSAESQGLRNCLSEFRPFHSNTTGRSHTRLSLLSLEYWKITECGPCYRAIRVNILYTTCGLIPSQCFVYITYFLPYVYLHFNLCLIRKTLPFPQKAFNWRWPAGGLHKISLASQIVFDTIMKECFITMQMVIGPASKLITI